MVIFHSYVTVYQRVNPSISHLVGVFSRSFSLDLIGEAPVVVSRLSLVSRLLVHVGSLMTRHSLQKVATFFSPSFQGLHFHLQSEIVFLNSTRPYFSLLLLLLPPTPPPPTSPLLLVCSSCSLSWLWVSIVVSHITSSGCSGPRLDPNTCQRECKNECLKTAR